MSRLNQVTHNLQTTGTPPLIIAAIRDICHDALGDICVVLHQLWMQEFLVDLNHFVHENHAALRMPPPVLGISSTLSTSSDSVSPSEAVFFN